MMKKIIRAFDNKDFGLLTSLVINHSFDPNLIIPDRGVTLFHLIIGHQSENFAFKVTKLFLQYGGNPNVSSNDGVTPVHVAAAWGRTRILHLLLVSGGDPWLQDDERKNAFNYAFEEQEWDAVEMLHHFQQIHSSGSCRRDDNIIPKFERNFKRVLLRKGKEIFEYSLPDDKELSSTKTQTDDIESSCNCINNYPSPVLSKIKYFESHPSKSEIGWRKPENVCIDLSNDFYQSSCQIIVDSNEKRPEVNHTTDNTKEELRSTGHYISSILIETSSPDKQQNAYSIVALDKSSDQSVQKSGTDVRSQLFLELQEAVLRRSKLRLNDTLNGKKEIPEETDKTRGTSNCSIVELSVESHSSSEKVPTEMEEANSVIIDDASPAKEISYLHEGNLPNNSLIQHMSDFATKVMKEIELSETENNLRNSSSSQVNLTGTYLTCEDDSAFNEENVKNQETFDISQNSFNASLAANSNDSFLSVAEEYKYMDEEEGVVLLETNYIVTPNISELNDSESDMRSDQVSLLSDISNAPSAISYASDTLRSELTCFGFNPGPITKTTKKLYLRKLWKLKKNSKGLSLEKKEYSTELEKSLKSQGNLEKVISYSSLEDEMMSSFDNFPQRRWREGVSKTSFNYLLLDPRISSNLPRRAMAMSDLEIWKCFLSSVFYVGKGKRARPYAHLYEAASLWHNRCGQLEKTGKIQYIMNIWAENLGVVCLHVFQNVIPVEAYTREAAMIDAIGLSNLKNLRCGEYYGLAATWTKKKKVKLGVYLLYKAMLIFLNEGERQIRPYDIT